MIKPINKNYFFDVLISFNKDNFKIFFISIIITSSLNQESNNFKIFKFISDFPFKFEPPKSKLKIG